MAQPGRQLVRFVAVPWIDWIRGDEARIGSGSRGRRRPRQVLLRRKVWITELTRPEDPSDSQQIDAKIKALTDWRGKTLSQLRALIKKSDARIVEEVKWKKPSNPAGVPVWSRDGIVCIGEPLKSAVRLTFPKGALVKDSKKLFNARLDSNSVRAIDFHEDDPVDEAALQALLLEAVRVNMSKPTKR